MRDRFTTMGQSWERGLRYLGVLGVLLGSVGCGDEVTTFLPPTRDEPAIETTLSELEGLAFESFVDQSYIAWLRRDPEKVSAYELEALVGIRPRWLTDISVVYKDETARLEDGILALMGTYDRSSMSTDMQIIYDAYQWFYEDRQRERMFRDYDYEGGIGFLPSYLFSRAKIETPADAEDYVMRVRQLPLRLEQAIARLQTKGQQGLLEPRVAFESYASSASRQIIAVAEESLYWQQFKTLTDPLVGQGVLSLSEQRAYLDEIADVIQNEVVRRQVRVAEVMGQLVPAAPDDLGLHALPGGDAYYAYLLRHHTTTELTADEIHDMGLAELTRIQTEMDGRFAQLGYPDTLSRFERFERLRVDGGTLTGNAAIDEYARILTEAEGRLPALFEEIPEIPYEIVPRGGGAYVAPSIDGSRAGQFLAPTEGDVPVFDMKALSYHEGMPGHHLQIALAIELDVPLFCRIEGSTGYVEGWGLYAEELAMEQGWYGDIETELGQLEFQAFRAARLVVDTGLHAKDWSFERAADFMANEAGLSEAMAQGQIWRYTTWPGQATGYYVGMKEILRLRESAQIGLGDAFDIRTFHSAVLNTGAMPLEVLGTRIEAYIGGDLGN